MLPNYCGFLIVFVYVTWVGDNPASSGQWCRSIILTGRTPHTDFKHEYFSLPPRWSLIKKIGKQSRGFANLSKPL